MKLNGVEINTAHEGCQFTTSKKPKIKLNTNRSRNPITFNGIPKSRAERHPPNIPKTNMQIETTNKIFKNILKAIVYLFMGIILLTFILPVIIDLFLYF